MGAKTKLEQAPLLWVEGRHSQSARHESMLFSTWIQIRSLNRRTRSARRLTPSRPNAPRASKRDVPTDIFPPSVVERIIGAQTYPADIVGATLILRYGCAEEASPMPRGG